MFTYKLTVDPVTKKEVTIIFRSDIAWVPFDPANTDYANFKRDIENGVELQDSEGVVMSADAAKEFIKTLP